MDKTRFLSTVATVSAIHIPRWNELPEFELYMDQVIALAEKYLGTFYIDGKAPLTPSMINNYVKSGVLPPPKNKRYNRTHLAILMIVCAMKPVMEISAVSDVITHTVSEVGMERALDEFARMFESELSASAKKADLAVKSSDSGEILSFIAIENTLRASAARTVAMHAYAAMTQNEAVTEKKKEKEEKPSKKKDGQKKKNTPAAVSENGENEG